MVLISVYSLGLPAVALVHSQGPFLGPQDFEIMHGGGCLIRSSLCSTL